MVMSTHGTYAAEEILDLVEALAEHLDWHEACGGYGLPRSQSTLVEAEDRSVMSRVAEPPREQAQRATDIEPVVAWSESDPLEQPRSRSVEIASKPAVVLTDEQRSERLVSLAGEVTGCTRCALHEVRKQAVFGVGRPGVDIMIVGEGPGAEEDEQGEPFVGKAGQLLDKMLAAMGYARGDVYIGNVVKCRPPGNRNPEPKEMTACLPYLHEQIELVEPRVILAMGTIAVRALLGASGVMRVRGTWKLYRARIPVMPTFHPAYLLRNEAAKRDAWTDLKAVMSALGHGGQNKPTR
jgi:DNA polymerase